MNRYRRRASWLRIIFSMLVYLALYVSVLISTRNYKTIFVAFMTLMWHTLANLYCSYISSYRFKKPSAKYVNIKNKFIRRIFIRRVSVGDVAMANKRDERINVIGFVLNIINLVMLVSFEVLLFLPKIPCEPYAFVVTIGSRPRIYEHIDLELDSLNQIIPAEASRLYFLAMSVVFIVFVSLFEHQLKEHKRKIESRTKKTPPMRGFKKTEWYSKLYYALIDISARKSPKKHKFWYEVSQLDEIETLVKAADECAELRVEKRDGEPVYFSVVDTRNDHVMFKGFFVK